MGPFNVKTGIINPYSVQIENVVSNVCFFLISSMLMDSKVINSNKLCIYRVCSNPLLITIYCFIKKVDSNRRSRLAHCRYWLYMSK